MDSPDTVLAAAAAAGDQDAFGQLLARHYDRLFGLCWRLTGVRAEAQDLVQDICIALPRKLPGWRAEGQFTTWLYRVAVNAAHDRRRRQAVRDRVARTWGSLELARQEDLVHERDARDWLDVAMQRLPPDLRDTVVLVLGEDLTQAEAAKVLGLSEGTVAWRMSQVKTQLRAMAAEDAAR